MRFSSLLQLSAILLVGFFLSGQTTTMASEPVIALLTDYGEQDAYVGQLKGAILSISPNAHMVDLTHNVAPFNIGEGSYLLNQCAQDFPSGTIFVAVVDPQVGTDRGGILLKTKEEKYYVGPDNGLFADVLSREGFAQAWKLDKKDYDNKKTTTSTFHGRDIFGPVAAHLLNGTSPGSLGTEIPQSALFAQVEKLVTLSGNLLTLKVLHIDHYGNIVTNLSSKDDLAAKLHEGDLVKLIVNKESYSAPLVKTYGEVSKDRLAILYGNSNLLEISKNQGSAVKELKVEVGQTIFIKP